MYDLDLTRVHSEPHCGSFLYCTFCATVAFVAWVFGLVVYFEF